MIHLENHSGCPAELLSLPDANGQEHEVLIVSATWVQSKTPGLLEPAAEPEPVHLADVHYGDPQTTSVRYDSHACIGKPMIDVIVNGVAYAPGHRAVTHLGVELQIGSLRKQVRVVGDRVRSRLGAGAPKPFRAMPVIYERAFGGTERRPSDQAALKVWRGNPIGVGHGDSRPVVEGIDTHYPNIEAVGAPPSTPAGFGALARGWSPRLEWAGTYDQQWLATQWPLPPCDFDLRHNQAAPLDQQLASVKAGDPVRLVNLTPDGLWQFAMPPATLPAWLLFDAARQEARPRLDTIVIEPEHRRVILTFRLALQLPRGRNRLREIVFGRMTPGLVRARQTRKPYIHPRDFTGRGAQGLARI